jgi:predicted RND superfamily exporter protein
MDVMARFLVRNRIAFLLVAILLVAVSLPLSSQLKMDRRLEKMLLANDPDVAGYLQLQRDFAASDVVLMIYRDEQLWDSGGAGIQRMQAIGDRLKEVPGVQAVLSLAELNKVLRTLRGARWLQPENSPVILAQDDGLAINLRELFSGYTHREGSPYAAIACMLEPVSAKEKSRDETLRQIDLIAQEMPDGLAPGELLGEPIMIHDGFDLLEADGARLGIASTLILAIVLLVLFRSIRWMVVPLLVVHWSLLVTRGLLVMLGGELSMVSSMLTAMVTVVGVATVIHILVEFQQQTKVRNSNEAMEATIRYLFKPVIWSVLTTAAGFASLTLARVGPVQDFGWIMSLAVLVTGAGTVLLVPPLALLGSVDRQPHEIPGDHWLRATCERIYQRAVENRLLALTVLGLLTLLALIGSSRLEVETDFIKSFREDSRLVKAYRTVEQNLGGAGVWDIVVPAPATLTQPYLNDLEKLQTKLRAIEVELAAEESVSNTAPKFVLRLSKVISVADAIKAASGDRWLGLLPASAKLEGMKQTMPEFMAAMLTEPDAKSGLRQLRIMLRSPESTNAAAKTKLIEAVRAEVQDFASSSQWLKHFGDEKPADPYITGYYLLLAKLVNSLLADQWLCFLVATAAIGVMLWGAMGSWWHAVASLVPNLLPIVLVWGIMGWLGWRVDMGAVMIAAVSVGLSIDGSIHYLLRARREVISSSDESGPFDSKVRWDLQLRAAQRSTGLALTVATIALVFGFLSLVVSDFRPTETFGRLVSLTMLGGLVGNLVILPILVAPRLNRRSS